MSFEYSDEPCPHTFDDSQLRIPGGTSDVYKDECMYCHHTAYHGDGVYVCTICFQGFCEGTHLDKHVSLTGHKMFLRHHKTAKPPKKVESISELGIEEAPDVDLALVCYECKKSFIDGMGTSEACCEAIAFATSTHSRALIAAQQSLTGGASATGWQPQPCRHCTGFKQVADRCWSAEKPLPTHPVCSFEGCEVAQNNWICLTCGAIGCPRAEAGGKQHAIHHFETTGHPLVAKVGTITAAGADIHCYACEDEVAMPSGALDAVMAAFGVNVASAVKTAKSLAEMELDQSVKHDYGRISEAGKKLDPAYGPGHTGLHNFGNTCYMNSVLQVLFTMPEFVDRYATGASANHQAACATTDIAGCFGCQMQKLACDMVGGKYASEETAKKDPAGKLNGITPVQFKSLVTKGHRDFSTGQQQDAEEFFRYLLQQLERRNPGDAPPSPGFLFDAKVEDRKACASCGVVKYQTTVQPVISLEIPVEPAKIPLGENGEPKKLTEEEIDAIRPQIDLTACFDRWLAEAVIDCRCEKCGQQVTYCGTTRLRSLPPVLAIHVRREYIDRATYQPKKLDVYVNVPETLDASCLRAPPRAANETVTEDSTKDASSAGGAASAPSERPVDELALTQVVSVGIEPHIAKWALQNTNDNVERAIDWVFSHPPPTSEETSAPPSKPKKPEPVDGGCNYQLFGMISHMGQSATSGHYIAHVKKNGRWLNCNDEKVLVSQDPPFRMASVYFFRRKE